MSPPLFLTSAYPRLTVASVFVIFEFQLYPSSKCPSSSQILTFSSTLHLWKPQAELAQMPKLAKLDRPPRPVRGSSRLVLVRPLSGLQTPRTPIVGRVKRGALPRAVFLDVGKCEALNQKGFGADREARRTRS